MLHGSNHFFIFIRKIESVAGLIASFFEAFVCGKHSTVQG